MNQIIHFVFVPTLLWSFLLFFVHLRVLGLDLAIGGHELTYASVLVLAYSVYYIKLSPDVGAAYALVLLAMYHNVCGIRARDRATARKKRDVPLGWAGTGYPLRLAGLAQLAGWYFQLHPGHMIFEGVKPALLDAFGQSFSVAPLFAFYEGVWALGLRPELRAQTAAAVVQHRAELCAAGGAFAFCK